MDEEENVTGTRATDTGDERQAPRGHAWERSAETLAHAGHLEAIFESIADAVVVCDEEGCVLRANGAARDLLGRDVVGQPLPVRATDGSPLAGARRLDGTTYPTPELPIQRAALRGETVHGAQFLVRDTVRGRDIPVLANSAPLRDAGGAITGAVIAFQNITAFKELEARLQTAVRLRDEFLSIAGHELRTPLTTVLGNVELAARWVDDLRDGADGADEAPPDLVAQLTRVALALRRAHRQGRVVTRLVTDLLDTSRIQDGRLALRLERHSSNRARAWQGIAPRRRIEREW